MDALVISKMNEEDEDEENEEVTLLKKREEAERKARRGELDPTHEYTFTILAQVCTILNGMQPGCREQEPLIFSPNNFYLYIIYFM